MVTHYAAAVSAFGVQFRLASRIAQGSDATNRERARNGCLADSPYRRAAKSSSRQ
jgi:hypothetical protein